MATAEQLALKAQAAVPSALSRAMRGYAKSEVKGQALRGHQARRAAAKRSYPRSQVRNSGRACQAAMAQERPRGDTPHWRSGGRPRGATPCPKSRGAWRGVTPRPRSGAASRGGTLRPRSGGAMRGAAPRPKSRGRHELLPRVRGQGRQREKLPCVQGQGRRREELHRLQGQGVRPSCVTPRLRSGAAAGRSYPTHPSPRPGAAPWRSKHKSKEPRLCRHRKA